MHVYHNTRRAKQRRGQCSDPGIFYHNGYRCMGYEEYAAMKAAELTWQHFHKPLNELRA